MRALALEHERLANHLGDLGALGNDAGFAFGLTQFSRMKEDLLRTNLACFGARYLMDFIAPGGVTDDLPEEAPRLLLDRYRTLETDVVGMRNIYDNHAGVQDRFRETGILSQENAWKLDAAGLPARASGIPHDLRSDFPWPPYDKMNVKVSNADLRGCGRACCSPVRRGPRITAYLSCVSSESFRGRDPNALFRTPSQVYLE